MHARKPLDIFLNTPKIRLFRPLGAILLVSLWLCAPASQAQTLDSLLNIADTLDDQDRFEEAALYLQQADSLVAAQGRTDQQWRLYLAWGDLYLGAQEYPKAINQYEPLRTLPVPAERDSALLVAKGLNDLGIAYYETGKLKEAREAHEESLTIYGQIDDEEGMQGLAYNYGNLANLAKKEEKPEEATRYYDQAREAAKEINDSVGIGIMSLNMGILYYSLNEHVFAVASVNYALQVFEDIRDSSRIMSSKRILSTMYMRLKDYASARPLLQESVTYYQTVEQPRNLARNYRTLGELFNKQQQWDSAHYYHNKALRLFERIENSAGVISTLIQQGGTYTEQHFLDSARACYNRVLAINQGQVPRYEANALLGLGFLLAQEGKFREALAKTEEVESYLGPEELRNFAQYHEIRYTSLKALGQYQQAMEVMELRFDLLAETYNEDKLLEIARLQLQNQIERERELQAAQLENERLRYRQQINRQRWITFSLLSGSLLLGLLFVNTYRSNRRKKLANLQLAEQNAVIENQNEELRAMNEQLKASHRRETELLQENLAAKERELASVALVSHEKNMMLSTIDTKLKELASHVEGEGKKELTALKKTVGSHLNLNQTWDSFFQHFQDVHPNFFDGLKQRNPNLTMNDLKLSAYLKIGMNNKEIASMSNLEVDSVKRSINRLKKKLELTPEDNVREFMMHFGG